MLSNFIDGAWVQGTGAETRDLNPARPAEVLDTFRSAGAQQVQAAAAAAERAFAGWRDTPFHERSAVLARAATILGERVTTYGEQLTREEGKTLAEGIGEVRRAAQLFTHFAAEANQSTGELYASPRGGEEILVMRVPVGPVALITPWNFPIAIPAWKVAPALAYGNTVVWKAAELVPILATRLVEALEEAGLPPGVCNLVLGGPTVGSALLDAELIRACSFTGSTAVGRRVAAQTAANGIRAQAEMGGANTVIVFADADVDAAAAAIVSGSMGSTGQRCTATRRVVVERRVFDDVVERVAALSDALRVGDPLDPATAIGPVASHGQLTDVREQLARARTQGARLVAGERSVDTAEGGFFVAPTVLVDVTAEDPVFTEELFGPVVSVVAAEGDAAALNLANRGPFGLSGSVFTRDLGRAMDAMHRFDVGVVHINSETPGGDPHVPFGGVKASGLGGREMGKSARDFYTELKTVYLRP